MPKLPDYKLLRSTPGTLPTNIVTPDFRHESGIAALGQSVGKVLQMRGEQLAREYDTVKAVGAFNAFSDSSRGMVQGLLKLESGAAEGAQGAYKEWYGKNQNEFTGTLNSQPQQAMFKQLADRRRETDLNHLARHEATQYKVQKKEALDGHATNADLAIREATTEALKTPGKDFLKADMVIENFLNGLESMFPGHDLKALRAKYTQTLRIAQLEEMMEIDPQTAREYIERAEIKDQLSFVENGVLKDAYPALRAKLKVETSRDNIDRAYHAMVARFPTDPGQCIKALYDEKIMKEFDLDVAERDRVVNTFRAEIQWARNVEEQQRKENADNQRKEIFELMGNGNMKQALDILDKSEDFTANEQTQIWSVIHTRASQYTDSDLSERIDEDIRSGDINKPSQISMYKNKGLSVQDTTQKQAMLKEHLKNPATMQFFNSAFNDWYEVEFAANDLMMEYEVYLKEEIRRQIHDPSINLKGPEILAKVKEAAGTMEDVYKDSFWSFLGFGEEKTRAPAGEDIERLKKERAEGIKRRKETSQPVKSEFAKDEFAEIPESAKAEIESMLKKRGYAITDDNMLKVYQRNKDKFADDIGITF